MKRSQLQSRLKALKKNLSNPKISSKDLGETIKEIENTKQAIRLTQGWFMVLLKPLILLLSLTITIYVLLIIPKRENHILIELESDIVNCSYPEGMKADFISQTGVIKSKKFTMNFVNSISNYDQKSDHINRGYVSLDSSQLRLFSLYVSGASNLRFVAKDSIQEVQITDGHVVAKLNIDRIGQQTGLKLENGYNEISALIPSKRTSSIELKLREHFDFDLGKPKTISFDEPIFNSLNPKARLSGVKMGKITYLETGKVVNFRYPSRLSIQAKSTIRVKISRLKSRFIVVYEGIEENLSLSTDFKSEKIQLSILEFLFYSNKVNFLFGIILLVFGYAMSIYRFLKL